ncbi:uncharacterized protein LOC111700241 isoform X4 [Eurytemora carolleeae]|uniref:uncharacterized protein LOC111700241 isoform X3 n=1 Tax=Eurytemora carolleeae TaxID=1294199 RepID=UPI000C77D964|nr:uncharacterized protein LOC111700241 isoform X3 [Eurytemora carolleeae]XP_023326879.1 uncharacterized protein LOC111700241 isoform X4 [Eurytemora carolleeae]|eukprot:XP_023326878.1 uncharacterized protein LOC111700241 isoform X3 [Eurytemora affinis]
MSSRTGSRQSLDKLRSGIDKYDRGLNTLTADIRKVENFYSELQKTHSKTFNACQKNGIREDLSCGKPMISSITEPSFTRRYIESREYSVGSRGEAQGEGGWNRINRSPGERYQTRTRSEVSPWVQQKYRSIEVQYPQYSRFRGKDCWEEKDKQSNTQRSILRSGMLFSPDSCRLAILESISMAWTADKYRHVETARNKPSSI